MIDHWAEPGLYTILLASMALVMLTVVWLVARHSDIAAERRAIALIDLIKP